jgi:hypothetical protein
MARFESDSEYERTLIIQSPVSHMLNPGTPEALVERARLVVDAIEMTMQLRQESVRLDDLLLNAADETLRRVIKDVGVEAICGFVENRCHLKRDKIAGRPEKLAAELLELLFSAAPMVENMIIESLCSRIGLRFEEREGFGFPNMLRN